MGGRGRRGGSKSRIMSPPPQPPPSSNATTNGNAATSEPVIKEEEEPLPAVNGHAPLTNGATPTDTSAPSKGEPEAKGSQQSYLALTKLGMGKKDQKGGGAEENNNNKSSEKSPKEGKKNGTAKDKGRKSMAEMASSTLKGFTKM